MRHATSANPLARWAATAAPLWLRDRVLFDPLLGFKLAAEVTLDAGVAIFAEARKPPAQRAAERPYFVSDLITGCGLDAALVLLIAQPAAAAPAAAAAASAAAGAAAWWRRLPSCALAPGGWGAGQRAGALALTAARFAAAGAAAGWLGQAAANAAAGPPPGDGDGSRPPPALRTAFVYALFCATSGALRYTLVGGIDAAVWALPGARASPWLAAPAAATLAARALSALVGGEQFVDIADAVAPNR